MAVGLEPREGRSPWWVWSPVKDSILEVRWRGFSWWGRGVCVVVVTEELFELLPEEVASSILPRAVERSEAQMPSALGQSRAAWDPTSFNPLLEGREGPSGGTPGSALLSEHAQSRFPLCPLHASL